MDELKANPLPPPTTTRPVRKFLKGSVANLGTGETTILTCPATMYARVDSIIANNPSAGTLLLTLHLVPAGGSAATTNALASVFSVGSHVGATVVGAGAIMGPGDVISGLGDAAGLNVWIGAEVVETIS